MWFWHLAVTNARYAVVMQRSSYMVMRYCHIFDADNGFTAIDNPMKGNVLLDNYFEGWIPWEIDGRRPVYPNVVFHYKGKEYDCTDVVAVNVSGEGTVVAYNRMKSWGDGIHGSGDQPKCANDFYGNEISESADDGIECDNGAQNIRCFDNRMTNCFQGISFQPIYGGPAYAFRNAIYNSNHCPFKIENDPHGILMINNTSVRAGIEPGPFFLYGNGDIFHYMMANNLFIGGNDEYAIYATTTLHDFSFDYDGYGPGPWKTFASLPGHSYPTLQDFQSAAGQEKHAVILQVKGLFASNAPLPESPDTPVALSVNDLLLAPGCAAIDAGCVVPGITDGYGGKAPDLGAYELAGKLPHYGPRPEK